MGQQSSQSDSSLSGPAPREAIMRKRIAQFFDGSSNEVALSLRNLFLTEIPRELLAVPEEKRTKLTGIDLGSNKITEIKEADLCCLPPTLVDFHASINQLSYVPLTPAVATQLPALKRVELATNNLTSLELANSVQFANLTHLNLDNNKLDRLPHNIGQAMPNLESLFLNNNQLTELPASLGQCSRLRVLKLCNNCLACLPTDVFAHLGSLEVLDVWNNQLESIPASLFNGLGGLTSATLGCNKLCDVPSTLFTACTRLTHLDLSSNSLSHLPCKIANLSGTLTTLLLKSNQLSEGGSEWLTHVCMLTSLTSLNLAHNKLRSLPTSVAGLTRLRSLYLHNNCLASVPAELGLLASSLRVLDLQANPFTELPADIYRLRVFSATLATSLPDEILPRLYLGGVESAIHVEALRARNVSHIVRVLKESPATYALPDPEKHGWSCLLLPILDTPSTDILSMLDSAVKFIEKALTADARSAVLVHCAAGISRSATVVTAYVMTHMKLPVREALTFVKSRRPIVDPNGGFIRQLHAYETTLKERGVLELPSQPLL